MKKEGGIGEGERGNLSHTQRPTHRCVQVLAGEPAACSPVRKDRGRMKRDGDITANKHRTRSSFQSDSPNWANPMVGCRMQQACGLTRGENRRSREERQGRNDFRLWQV